MFRFFMNLCRDCHDWVHDNPAEAAAKGYLLEANSAEEDWELSILNKDLIINYPDEVEEDFDSDEDYENWNFR